MEPCTWQVGRDGFRIGSLERKLIENSWEKDPPHNPGIPGAWERALEHGGTASHLLQNGVGVGGASEVGSCPRIPV